MTGEGIRKKREPIFSVCFIVFVVACVGVLGVYVDEHYLEKDDSRVAYGDSVKVNYIGTFYAKYGDTNAVVFDTSVSSVGNNDSVLKSNSFSKSSYSLFDVTVGSGEALKDFENCLVGHKVGDKIYIEIEDAYAAPPASFQTADLQTTIETVQTMSKTNFDSLYSDVSLTGGSSVMFKTAYGWDAMATYSTADNIVTITNMPEAGKTYEYTGNEDSKFGKISFAVSSISNGITYTMSFSDTTAVSGGIQMIEMNVDGNTVYITEIGSSTYTYKTCSESYGIKLYFEITVESIS